MILIILKLISKIYNNFELIIKIIDVNLLKKIIIKKDSF